jgi:hypothetical protein
MQTGKDAHSQPQTKKTEHARAKIPRKSTLNYCGNYCKTGINVAWPWWKSHVPNIFTQHWLGTNGLQLNHTRSRNSDLELQYAHASAALPIVRRKYPTIASTFLISVVVLKLAANRLVWGMWNTPPLPHRWPDRSRGPPSGSFLKEKYLLIYLNIKILYLKWNNQAEIIYYAIKGSNNTWCK